MQMLAVSSTEYGCMGIFRVVIEILKELPRQNRMSRQATPFVSFRACEGETRISWEIQSCKRQATPFVSFGACEGETRITWKFNSVSHSGTMWLVLILEAWPISVSGQLPTYPSPNPTTVY